MSCSCRLLLQAVSQLPVSEVKGDQQWAGVLLVFAHGDLSPQLLPWRNERAERNVSTNAQFCSSVGRQGSSRFTVFKGVIIAAASCWFWLSFASHVCVARLNIHSAFKGPQFCFKCTSGAFKANFHHMNRDNKWAKCRKNSQKQTKQLQNTSRWKQTVRKAELSWFLPERFRSRRKPHKNTTEEKVYFFNEVWYKIIKNITIKWKYFI